MIELSYSRPMLKTIKYLGKQLFSSHQSWSNHSKRYSSTSVIGFIGLGNMGKPMIHNLIKANYKLIAFDVDLDCVSSVAALGVHIAKSPAEVAADSTCIITMLPNSSHVEQVYCGADGILSSVQTGTLMIDSSTIDPSVSKKVAAKATEKSAFYIDAPVSGGVSSATAGTLTFMVGASTKKYEEAKSILEHVGKNVVHCGDVGTGQAAKICNNMLAAISMIGVSESMNLGIKLGLDPKILAGIFNTSSGRCWSSDTYNFVPGVMEGVPSSNDYQGGFRTALMAKDLGLAQQAASDTKSPTPLGSSALQIYRLLCQKGFGEKDFSSVFNYLKSDLK